MKRIFLATGVLGMGIFALAAAGCSTGGTDDESPLPGTEETGPTVTTPQVVTPPNPNSARPTTTTIDINSRAAATTTTTIRTRTTTYVVQRGDNLGSIALQFPGVSVDDIVRANNLANANEIFAEQELTIPLPTEIPATTQTTAATTDTNTGGGGSSAANEDESGDASEGGRARTSASTYTVQSGDNLGSIALQFPGVTVDDIVRANNLANANEIQIGQELTNPAP